MPSGTRLQQSKITRVSILEIADYHG